MPPVLAAMHSSIPWSLPLKTTTRSVAGSLVPGQTFQNLAELRTTLVRDMSDQFVKNLADNLLIYALVARHRILRQVHH